MHPYSVLLKSASPPRPFSFCHFFILNIFILALFIIPSAQSSFAATWQADFTIRVSSPRTQTILFSGTFYQEGLKVRIEAAGSEEVNLFDFKSGIRIRVFPKDRIYFTNPLSAAKIIKAAKEAWITAPLPYLESKILLWTGEIKGKAARLYLMTLTQSSLKSHALRWVTDDLHETPLRIIYSGPANETVIVDYEPISGKKFSADYFEPPTNYLSLNPF